MTVHLLTVKELTATATATAATAATATARTAARLSATTAPVEYKSHLVRAGLITGVAAAALTTAVAGASHSAASPWN